ncbi:hypothetical protein [Ensifer sp. YR511]|uniref:hypothetical protein n=1 Tax=Ensifer sp. YR511 TaxID=1855294 RepID=UPI00087F64AF|nr:hypothetical protein [Ensifer sp. YR511]MBD9596518.1 hypothetical protein [Ensifer sp. ENS05]SDN64788.1 hypothetical protein SAMN05216328_1326 [Ensifer sp. YR511]
MAQSSMEIRHLTGSVPRENQQVWPLPPIPFLGTVAELNGRLSALQSDCTSAEVHRRMSEIYGEREGTCRMTNLVIQAAGAVERVEKGKRILRLAP